MTAAEKQKQYRCRKNAGIKVVKFEVSPQLAYSLVMRGFVSGAQIDDAKALSDGIKKITDHWVREF